MYEYALDLETLLALLGEVNQDGILSVMLLSGFLGLKGRCSVEIQLIQGEIVYCHVEDNRGNMHVFDPGKAFKALNSLGVLDWQFTKKLDSASHTHPSQSSNVPPPAFSAPLYSAPHNPLGQANGQHPNISAGRNTDPLQPLFAPQPPGNRPISTPLGNTHPLPLPNRFDTPPLQYFGRDSGYFRTIAALVPKLRVNIDTRLLNSLPRKNRRVLVLIDGVRSVEMIHNILSPSSQDINGTLGVLVDLERLGIITVY